MLAALLVVVPGLPLGTLTLGVQVLAGIFLPSATVFLLLLCNDTAVLGPGVNTAAVNAFAGLVIAMLIALSVVLTAATLYPAVSASFMIWTVIAGAAAALLTAAVLAWTGRETAAEREARHRRKAAWCMPPLTGLTPLKLAPLHRWSLVVLRMYLAGAVALVVVKIVQLALHSGA